MKENVLVDAVSKVDIAVETIAQMAHEANRVWCEKEGDYSQVAWHMAPKWQKDSARNGVWMHINNPNATPEDSHKSWLAQKEAEGWVYGKVKNVEAKEHPCMMPYNQLPLSQRAKDSIFTGVVKSLLAFYREVGDLPPAPMTIGQKVMNVSFNPGQNPAVTAIKQAFADTYDICQRYGLEHRNKLSNALEKAHGEDEITHGIMARGDSDRCMANALTNLETAQMYAVKSVTR